MLFSTVGTVVSLRLVDNILSNNLFKVRDTCLCGGKRNNGFLPKCKLTQCEPPSGQACSATVRPLTTPAS